MNVNKSVPIQWAVFLVPFCLRIKLILQTVNSAMTLTSVRQESIIVRIRQVVKILEVHIAAHVMQDTLEMEHTAEVRSLSQAMKSCIVCTKKLSFSFRRCTCFTGEREISC